MALIKRGAQLWKIRFAWVFAFFSATSVARGATNGESNPLEYRVKAAMIYNFAKFIDWPHRLAPGKSGPFVLCVYGTSPFPPGVLQELAKKKMKDRDISIKTAIGQDDISSCHVVFFGATAQSALPTVLQKIGKAEVLTVGEGPGFTRSGGTIELNKKEEVVVFEVNLDAARKAGLDVSSQLLKIANKVIGEAAIESKSR